MLYYDCVYLVVTLSIDIYESKQSKTAIVNVNKSNGEIYSVIGALVVDICQRIQNSKLLFLSNTAGKQLLKKIDQQRFFSLCSLIYINNQSTYNSKSFIV